MWILRSTRGEEVKKKEKIRKIKKLKEFQSLRVS
jgi:hypothetical protein